MRAATSASDLSGSMADSVTLVRPPVRPEPFVSCRVECSCRCHALDSGANRSNLLSSRSQ
jgi:hypothetical protein